MSVLKLGQEVVVKKDVEEYGVYRGLQGGFAKVELFDGNTGETHTELFMRCDVTGV